MQKLCKEIFNEDTVKTFIKLTVENLAVLFRKQAQKQGQKLSRCEVFYDLISRAVKAAEKQDEKQDGIYVISEGITALAKQWGWTRESARSFLKELEQEGIVKLDVTVPNRTAIVINVLHTLQVIYCDTTEGYHHNDDAVEAVERPLAPSQPPGRTPGRPLQSDAPTAQLRTSQTGQRRPEGDPHDDLTGACAT